jgi:hypothetical protein
MNRELPKVQRNYLNDKEHGKATFNFYFPDDSISGLTEADRYAPAPALTCFPYPDIRRLSFFNILSDELL